MKETQQAAVLTAYAPLLNSQIVISRGLHIVDLNVYYAGGAHKTVLEMFSENGVALGLCRFFVV